MHLSSAWCCGQRSFSTSGRERAFHLQLLLPLAGAVGRFCTSSLRNFLQTQPGWWGQVQQIPACPKIAPSGEHSCLGCRDGSSARSDGRHLQQTATEISRVAAFCRARSCPYAEMFSFHKICWKMNTMISEVCWKCSLESWESVHLSPKLTIPKVASFTFKKNKVFLFGSISSSSFIPSFSMWHKTPSPGPRGSRDRRAAMVVSRKDSRAVELNQQILICWFNWVQTS